MSVSDDGADPRLDPTIAPAPEAQTGPQVARAAGGPGPVITVSVFAIAAVALFLFLNSQRTKQPEAASLVAPAADAIESQPEPPLQLPPPPPPAVAEAAQPAPTAAAAPGPFVPPPPIPVAVVPAVDPAQRRRAPAVVVDLDAGTARIVPASVAAPSAPIKTDDEASEAAPAALLSGAEDSDLGPNESFADRIAGASTSRAVATPMRNLAWVVPQGAMIPAVLETALNSDLPGYTRAVVSRDVRSFDGKNVLIPRGSRLIGQYQSAVSLGQSRAFVIWSRVVRPDGVSVQIGSPGVDTLGQGGLAGQVDRHFLQRFGGSILLSVLNAGVAAISRNASTSISIASPGAAVGAANSALQGDMIAPTVKVPQGEAIQIFVARDLDFSGVGAAP